MEQGGGVDGASQRLAYWLAWATCALSLTLTALNFLLIALNVSLNTPAYVFWPELTSLAVGYSDRRNYRLAPAQPSDRLDL